LGDRPLQRYPLTAWARRVGLTARQARYAVSTGELVRLQLPPGGRVERLPSGRLEVFVPSVPRLPYAGVALYARAWRKGASGVLARQMTALQTWAQAHEVEVLTTVREVAGPFDLPEALLQLVIDPSIPVIVVANKDVLGWLNAPFLTAILESQGRQLLDIGLVEACVREDWSALNDVQRVCRVLLRDLHRAIEVRLPLPRDPPAPISSMPP
jgi:predicted site-specific integrase-resolvase